MVAKWKRLEVERPVFQKAKRGRGPRAFAVGDFPETWYWVKRYISPTAAWVEQMGARDAMFHLMEDTSTPMMRLIRPQKNHE